MAWDVGDKKVHRLRSGAWQRLASNFALQLA
jgi:hypothetical protein